MRHHECARRLDPAEDPGSPGGKGGKEVFDTFLVEINR
jgi:hypothetical protein